MPNHLTMRTVYIELDDQKNMIVWRDAASVQVPAAEVKQMLVWLLREHHPELAQHRELLADAAELLAASENNEQVKSWQARYKTLIHGS